MQPVNVALACLKTWVAASPAAVAAAAAAAAFIQIGIVGSCSGRGLFLSSPTRVRSAVIAATSRLE